MQRTLHSTGQELSVKFKFPSENLTLTVHAEQDSPMAFLWVEGRSVDYFEKLLSFEPADLDLLIATLSEARKMIREREPQV
ncbi:hypothetical protein phiCbK_090 [Caulobacter phage phiCbK]|uniref:Uncharacterized protein n=5 Tax=Viruses TaxID=10239 RepID=J3UI76_9CAUD|nr:hypothetical protein D865_gp187 [Caulobacter phage phiCbK]AFO71604.1 hypothetical protein phiCbK_090 [Caulobacter phage phiCbK]AFU87063.1 hypothetical protein CbK_gp231 [Caulobacter phage phiCbK]ARB15144.1 hypothetical protein Ccr32_gp226 [Caulobacter phage Ccr32]ARB15478.1 hypothetical protein Ccr34_gp236 [Caulobacter phage Ccr34]